MPENQNDYWTSRYHDSNTPWDMGSASPPLTGFLQKLTAKAQRILLPGAGNAYEAEWLWHNGFTNVFVMDISAEPLQNLKKRVPDFHESQLLHTDFFKHHGPYDLIVEQTFFCALDPALRPDYVKQMHKLLKPGGQLFGVLFYFPLTEEGPPFGGSAPEYRQLFEKHFKLHRLERCYNSIEPRAGSELFFRAIRK